MSEKYRETDEKILVIARRMFAQRGIVNVEMKDICLEIGCSRSTLYRHYSSKEEILIDLTHESVRKIMDAAIIPPRMTFENGYEALSWQLRSQMNYMMNNTDEVVFIRDFDYFFTKNIPTTPQGKEFEENMSKNRGRDELLGSLKKGINDGSIHQVNDLDLTIYTLVNTCIAISQRILPRESIYRTEVGYGREMIEDSVNMLLQGLKN